MRLAVFATCAAFALAVDGTGSREECPAPTAEELSLLQRDARGAGRRLGRNLHHQSRQQPGPGKAGTGHPMNRDIVAPKRGLAIDVKDYSEKGKLCPILSKFGGHEGAIKPWFFNYRANDSPNGVLLSESDYQSCVFEYDSGYVPMESVDAKGLRPHPLIVADGVLGFNEPYAGQFQLSPWEAAQLWPQVTQRAKDVSIARIGSPAASGERSWDWYDAFFDECQYCQVDFITTNVFKPNVLGPNSLQAVLGNLWETYSLPLWVTEFNSGGRKSNRTMEQQLAFMQAALPFLEALPYVERYAWHSTFGRDVPGAALISRRSRQLTKLGKFYRDYRLPVGSALSDQEKGDVKRENEKEDDITEEKGGAKQANEGAINKEKGGAKKAKEGAVNKEEDDGDATPS